MMERADILEAVLNQDLDKLAAATAEDKECCLRNLPIQLGPHHRAVSAIMVASHYGHILVMRKLFENKNNNLYCRIITYKRSLLLAAAGGHSECFCLLSQHGLFHEEFSGRYPGSDKFILAAEKRDFDLVQDLLDRGVGDSWIHGVGGGSIMSLLILNDCPLKCLVSMIDHGASVNQHDNQGFTPLMTAVIASRVECAQALIQMKADVNLEDGITMGYYSRDDSDYKDKFGNIGDGKTALMYAVNVNSLECVILLLKHGIELDGSDKSGFTALMHAVCARNSECVKQILNSGLSMDINTVDNDERTALIHAGYAGEAMSVELLLDAKANHTQKDIYLRTAFMAAVSAKNTECAKTLLKRFPPKLDSKDFMELTSLDHAMITGNAELLGLLIDELKANVETDSVCSTLNELLCRADQVECVEILIKNGCDVEHRSTRAGKTPIMFACSSTNSAPFHFLVKCGANLNAVDDTKTSVLMHAIDTEIEVQGVVEFLLKNGVDVNCADDEGNTPLMLACREGKSDYVELFIEYGANVNAVNGKKECALMFAAMRDHLTCFELILVAGADVDLADERKRTIFDQVLEANSQEFLKILIDSGKLFEDGQLKGVHKKTFEYYYDRHSDLSQPTMVMLMENRFFDWSWYSKSWQTFAAVVSGISPGVFKTEYSDPDRAPHWYDLFTPESISYENNNVLTPLQFAFLETQPDTVRFLLVNHYFTMQDYRVFTSNKEFQSAVKEEPLYAQITSQPWSLRTLSLISISTSIALSDSDLSRAEQVDSLLVPDKFKAKLKFQGPLSRLCPSDWEYIGKPPGSKESESQDLLSLTQPVFPYPDNLTQCQRRGCGCDGMGLAVQITSSFSSSSSSHSVSSSLCNSPTSNSTNMIM